MKIFNIRKSQNLSNFGYRESVYLLSIDLDVLLKNSYVYLSEQPNSKSKLEFKLLMK